ncbi:HEAT repeat domain-containing protein [Variovorax sp. UC74_104]|uniref:HEAT repeat domain-containing protein n=1 Tax=Variovorax sp. UC74_104 TaxID=3374555 RepID=UPI0037566007
MKKTTRSANKTRTRRQLVRVALRHWGSDRHSRAIFELQQRGSMQTLELAQKLSRNASWRRRALGLYIASQLQKRTHNADLGSIEYAVNATSALLFAGLHDPHEEVVCAAASGLGHRPHPQALPELVQLASHSNKQLRWTVAVTLGRYPEPAAIEALLQLAHDPDDDVRDWATFGLGTSQEADTPQIRDRLWKNLHDHHEEVRGEALVGLAERGDTRVIDYLSEHLNAKCRVYELKAAEKIASPRLLEALQAIARDCPETGLDGYWVHSLQSAIAACGGSSA